VVELAGLDRSLAYRWTFVRAVDAWLEGSEFPSPEAGRVAEVLGNH
jgi:hypothetical protein